jgi:DNA polymerase/3'-5' exonuclease PolX
MGGEKRYPYEVAYPIAAGIVYDLRPFCERIEIAGSLRRHRNDVGDIEILYIPVIIEEPDDTDLFATREADTAHDQIQKLERNGVLARRLSKTGHQAYGPKNKLLLHVASGIPVDLFAANRETWWNQLVCRTGPAELNKEIAAAALAKGWHWNVYGSGFSRIEYTESVEMHSEAEVFAFVGMSCLDPEHRGRR